MVMSGNESLHSSSGIQKQNEHVQCTRANVSYVGRPCSMCSIGLKLGLCILTQDVRSGGLVATVLVCKGNRAITIMHYGGGQRTVKQMMVENRETLSAVCCMGADRVASPPQSYL